MQKKQSQENLPQESNSGDFKRYRPDVKCEELIRNIHDLCERKGKSHYALAKMADVSPSTLHELMTGKTKPYLYTVYKICNALDISISDLLLEESSTPGMVSELNEKERELIYLYRECSNKKKEHLELYLRMLAQYDADSKN